MTEEQKIYYPETIEDNHFPGEEVETFIATQEKSNEMYEPLKTKAQAFPLRKVAHEVIGSALNTKSRKILAEFEFTQSGSLQIGEYENGVSGDIKISPNGIVARNESGITTFALDGTTGDAVFKGTVQTGTLISGIVAVGDNNVVIDGENKNIVVYDESGIARILIGFQAGGF